MRTNFYSVVRNVVKQLLAAITVFLSFGVMWGTANATLINFDDLEYVIVEDGEGDMFYDHPVTNAYLSKGLLITNGYLSHSATNNTVSPPNALLGSEFLTLDFVGAFPKFVGMNVNGALNGEAVLFDIYSASGAITHARTGGDANSPGEDLPYVPNEFISFNVPDGITRIQLSNYFDRRLIGTIDNLVYEYAAVPEPSSLLLFSIGLLGCILRQKISVTRIKSSLINR